MSRNDIQYLYNSHNEFQGVMISAALWRRVGENVKSEVKRMSPGAEPADSATPDPAKEPLQDWERFLKFWDFRYPPESSVLCKSCGNQTQDWTADEPRKFVLKAANIGGLVSFHCCACGARVMKRHFKDSISFEFQLRSLG